MNKKIESLLHNKGGNYIFPFFWQHGEDETTLRKYMDVIEKSNIKAVCVESRPHPDFCGPKWWQDLDVILDEARKRNMKVWILDDSHFPTGFAGGAMANQPDKLCRQSICCRIYECAENENLIIEEEELLHPDPFKPTLIENYAGEKNPRKFDDDRLLGLYAIRFDEDKDGFTEPQYRIDLSKYIENNRLEWKVPKGKWKVYALHLSRNMGYHRSYINMMDKESCKVLIDNVYELHYERYKDDFGKTIAGFFSDEPELGNGHLYEVNTRFGTDVDFPWSTELEDCLKEKLGEDFAGLLPLLWEEEADSDKKAAVRYIFMDTVTRLVEKNFSMQIGEWCRKRGVQYIGHLIEDNNQHARTGSSLGHFYRGMAGQDMAGIDCIKDQILPQGEDLSYDDGIFRRRDGEFFHYMLGKLGSSFGAIDPLKQGKSMCEIFGASGWQSGVRLQKYMVDHFLVRGINHYVPHAFSPKEFPDPDCPPHFYAHGNNPQYRHFGYLMAYTNRICELINDGYHVASVAVLYHGEGEWTGRYMFSHRVGRILADNQIDYDYIPQDVFEEANKYKTQLDDGILKVNTQEYKAVVVPAIEYITEAFAEYIIEMNKKGIDVIFIDEHPAGICDILESSEKSRKIKLMEQVKLCPVVKLDDLVQILRSKNIPELAITPSDNRIRYYHYEHRDGSGIFIFVNEGKETYKGAVKIKDKRSCYLYNAWNNCIHPANYDGMNLQLTIEPLHSKVVVFDSDPNALDGAEGFIKHEIEAYGEEISLNGKWERSICRSIDYPEFKDKKTISLPDTLAEEEKEFSGFVRYDNTFTASPRNKIVLEISDAHEGVEVFINDKSLGIQIAPPFIYDISEAVKEGENHIRIEVATTLEREMAVRAVDRIAQLTGEKKEPTALSGITGEVKLYKA